MKQELLQGLPKLLEVRQVAARYTENIQKPAKLPNYLLGQVTQPSDSR